MDRRGFTLIEILVVICVCSILTSIATIQFRSYLKRYQSESQTRALRSELLHARIAAVTQHKKVTVRVYPDHFNRYSSSGIEGDVEPLVTKKLTYPVRWNNGDTEFCDVKFDVKGMVTDERTICIDDTDGTGAVDSVVISFARTALGKRDSGKECAGEHITRK